MNKNALLSLTLLIVLVANIAAIAVPASAYVTGTVAIIQPDMVVPGGAIEIELSEDFQADGGYVYIYLSKDADPEISSGDVRIAKLTKSDIMAELPYVTSLEVPTTIQEGEEYYVKVTDSSKVGASCIVSEDSVEVLEKDEWPTITIDPESGSVPREVTVEGEDINEDWEMLTVELYWDDYEQMLGTWDVEDFTEFTAEDVPIPEAFMGKHKILVLLRNEETVGTYVEFEVEPSVDLVLPATFSLLADEPELEQTIQISAHGFPEGTVEADSIKVIVKDFVTGSVIDTFSTEHDEVEIESDDPYKGTFEEDGAALPVTVYDALDEGIADIQIKVDGETFTFEDMFLISKTDDVGKFNVKMDVTSGEIGDSIEFTGIRFPANVEIDVIFDGPIVRSLADDLGETIPSSDVNGAWKYTFTLRELPGGEYTVKIKDVTNAVTKTIGTFTIKPSVAVEPDETVVGGLIDITGDGFPPYSSFDTVVIGSEEVEIDVYVEDDGIFEALGVEVPHVSGGGQEVPVKIQGEDLSGNPVTIETSIVINPDIESLDWKDPELDEWVTDIPVFAGDVLRFKGTGFKAGEKVTITFENGDGVEETADIMSGGVADSDGDLEVIFRVPTGRKFAKSDTWTVTIAGPTDGNKYEMEVDTSALNDDEAKLFFGLADDGSLVDEVYVGDTIVVIGVGFDTRDLTLEFGGEEVKSVTASYGYFKTTIKIPELQRGTYYLEETETGARSLDVTLKSKVELSTEKAASGAEVTVKGTGWVEDQDVDIIWPGLPTLVTVEPDEDGSWEATFTVPSVSPGTYTLTFDDGVEVLEETFMVLGPLRITSLSMPTDVYVGSEITITVNVMDYFNAPVSGASVSGKVWLPETGVYYSLLFEEISPGVYTTTYAVPDMEGSYRVEVTASKPEAGGSTTATGSFYASKKPPAPPDITDLVDKVSALTDNVDTLTSNVNKLASSVDKLTSDVSGVSSTVDSLSASVSGLTSDVSKLTSNVDALSSKVDSLSASVSALSSGVSEASSKAEAAAATAANLTTLMYIAIIFSLLAFIFAIVSVVQLSRKIA